MELTERVQRLQRESKEAISTLDPERALLLTRFYQGKDSEGLSTPVQRARAFEYILLNKKISIADGEILVGERDRDQELPLPFRNYAAILWMTLRSCTIGRRSPSWLKKKPGGFTRNN